MNSNSRKKNEILADARMKSAIADEIFGFASDEIKSTHPPSRRISSNEVGFHRRRRFHPPARVDLVEKKHLHTQVLFSGPSGGSRTHGLLNPIQARYQTALRPDVSFWDLSIISHFFLFCKGVRWYFTIISQFQKNDRIFSFFRSALPCFLGNILGLTKS